MSYIRKRLATAQPFVPKKLSASAIAEHDEDNLDREVKYVDSGEVVWQYSHWGAPPVGQMLPFPVQGSQPYNCVGAKLAMKSLRVTGFIYLSNLGVGVIQLEPQYLRLLIVHDRQHNGVMPVWSDVVEAYTSAGVTSSYSTDAVNMNNRERFVVVYDERTRTPLQYTSSNLPTTTTQTEATGGSGKWFFDDVISLVGLEGRLGDPSVGDGIASGALCAFLAYTSHEVVNPADIAWVFRGSFRVRFDDL